MPIFYGGILFYYFEDNLKYTSYYIRSELAIKLVHNYFMDSAVTSN